MKKSGFLLSTFYFLFSNIACVPHDISVPDEADAALPPSFESVLKKKLYSLDSYYLSDSSIPVESIMNNINFKSFDEEVAYYKKNAKNPNNLNIAQAVRNMDANLDGQCDKCGMAILHCIESGMENM